MDAKAAAQKSFEKMRNAVGRDGIGPYNNQWKSPLPVTLNLDNPRERRQKQETNPSAKNRPRRRPDPLHHRTNLGVMQHQPQGHPRHASQQESLYRKFALRLAHPQP